MKDLYGNDFKSLKKENEEDIRWKGLPCSWVSKTNIVRMTILPKTIYRVNTIPIKTSTHFFIDLERTIPNFVWKTNKTQAS